MDLSRPCELRARRLIAQALAPTAARPRPGTVAEAIRWMGAVQGQNYGGGIRALGLRAGRGEEAVLQAVAHHDVVRCWPQRGTLHFLPAADARWMVRLGNPRVASSAATRLQRLGLSPEEVATARRGLHEVLLADGPLTRPAVYETFAAVGVDPASGRGPYLIRLFGREGDVVQGPRQGKTETFLHLDALPLRQNDPDPGQALSRLLTRYLHSHGPATMKDLVWWTGLGSRVLREGLRGVADVLEVPAGGETYWLGAWQEAVTAEELEAALAATYRLPAFDEYLLGYADKSYALPQQLRPQVLTTNGLSWPFLVEDGVVVGRDAH